MDIIAFVTARIEEYRSTNKQPCKNYATREAAIKATAAAAQKAATHFDVQGRADAEPARYVVFYIEPWGRWVGALDFTELLRRKNSTGGYLFCCPGFFTY
jgi:hypothetical protein